MRDTTLVLSRTVACGDGTYRVVQSRPAALLEAREVMRLPGRRYRQQLHRLRE